MRQGDGGEIEEEVKKKMNARGREEEFKGNGGKK